MAQGSAGGQQGLGGSIGRCILPADVCGRLPFRIAPAAPMVGRLSRKRLPPDGKCLLRPAVPVDSKMAPGVPRRRRINVHPVTGVVMERAQFRDSAHMRGVGDDPRGDGRRVRKGRTLERIDKIRGHPHTPIDTRAEHQHADTPLLHNHRKCLRTSPRHTPPA